MSIQPGQAHNSVGILFQSVGRFQREVAALKTNELGQTIALYPDLVVQARRFLESDVADMPTTGEVITKWESVRRIEQNLLANAGTAYEPESDILTSTITIFRWAEDSSQKIEKARAILAALIRESKAKVTGAKVVDSSPSLETAIAQLGQAESIQGQQTIVAKTTEAKGVAIQTIANAEAQRIIQEARIKADSITREAEELAAKHKRDQILRDAQAGIETSSNKVSALKAQEEARKILLRQRTADPKVKALLAPFTSPGLWQPRAGAQGGEIVALEKKPISLNRLAAVGALTLGKQGIDALYQVANSTRDTDRPRWGFRSNTRTRWYENEENLKMVTEAQSLLIELGPTLVETGELQP